MQKKVYKNSMSSEDKQKIANYYLTGKTVKETAQHFGFTEGKTLYIIKSITPRRKKGNFAIVDHDYFKIIDSEHKAYWLGFLTADGCVTDKERYKRICITLKASDHLHLQKFLDDTKAKVKIGYCTQYMSPPFKDRRTCNVKISSNIMAQDLIDKGIIPRKCGHCYPYDINPDLERHYWRGLIDGDGSVLLCDVYSKKGTLCKKPFLNLTGDYAICDGFAKFCHRFITSKSKVSFCKNTTYLYQIHYRKAFDIMSILYDGADIYLDRKYNNYLVTKDYYSNFSEESLKKSSWHREQRPDISNSLLEISSLKSLCTTIS